MDKKKAIVCTVLFGVIVLGTFISTLLIKSKYGFSIFDVISPCICGAWAGGKVRAFYKWLITK